MLWVVEGGGGKYKGSYLLPGGEDGEEGLLICETVVPGFEVGDHDFFDGGEVEGVGGGGAGEGDGVDAAAGEGVRTEGRGTMSVRAQKSSKVRG